MRCRLTNALAHDLAALVPIGQARCENGAQRRTLAQGFEFLRIKPLASQLLPDGGEQVRWRNPLLVQRKMPLNTDRQSQHRAHHDKRHDPAARGQHLKHKQPSLREPEYTEPPRSAPDRVLAGIYGNFSQYGAHSAPLIAPPVRPVKKATRTDFR